MTMLGSIIAFAISAAIFGCEPLPKCRILDAPIGEYRRTPYSSPCYNIGKEKNHGKEKAQKEKAASAN